MGLHGRALPRGGGVILRLRRRRSAWWWHGRTGVQSAGVHSYSDVVYCVLFCAIFCKRATWYSWGGFPLPCATPLFYSSARCTTSGHSPGWRPCKFGSSHAVLPTSLPLWHLTLFYKTLPPFLISFVRRRVLRHMWRGCSSICIRGDARLR